MHGPPMAFGVAQTFRDFVEPCRFPRLDQVLLGGRDAGVDAQIGDVGHRACGLGQKLGHGLARVLVVFRDGDAKLGLDVLQHLAPVGPFGRAVVADHIRRLGMDGQDKGRAHGKGKARDGGQMFHGV